MKTNNTAAITKYLKANTAWFDMLDFLTMSMELKAQGVMTDTKEIGEVFDALYS